MPLVTNVNVDLSVPQLFFLKLVLWSSLSLHCSPHLLLVHLKNASATVLEQVDKYRKHCLWRVFNINAKKSPKSSMTMPCKPKDEGDLCGINLRTQMKHSLQKIFINILTRRISGGST